MKFIILFITGYFAGTINMVVGAGSFFSIPALLLFGLSSKIAVATNRFCIIFLTISGATSLYKAKVLDIKRALKFSAIASAGSIIGAHLVIKINEVLMRNIVMALILVIFFNFIFPVTKKMKFLEYFKNNDTAFYIILFCVGIYGGFFGVAITVFFISTMVFIKDIPMIEAISTNQVIVLGISVFASAIFLKDGLIDFSSALPLATGMSLGSLVTSKYITKLNPKVLKKIFIITLGLMILILILKSFS